MHVLLMELFMDLSMENYTASAEFSSSSEEFQHFTSTIFARILEVSITSWENGPEILRVLGQSYRNACV